MRKKKEFVIIKAGTILSFALALSFLGLGQQKTKPNNIERPNIIFILTDDLGWGDLSCQGATDLKNLILTA